MNLTDKDIASDVLTMAKHSVTDLTWAALECSNVHLRQTLRQIRDHGERAQERIGQIASTNGWYLPSESTDHKSVGRVASHFAQGAHGVTGARQPGGQQLQPGGQHQVGQGQPYGGGSYGFGQGQPYGGGQHFTAPGAGYRDPRPPQR